MNVRILHSVLATTLVIGVAGCITNVKTFYQPSTVVKGGEKASKSIAYNFIRTSRCATNSEFDPKDYSTDLKGAWAAPQEESTALRQLWQTFSGMSTAVNPTVNKTGGDCDVFMDIMQQNSWNGLGLFAAAISGFTFTILPCWGDDTYTLYADVSDRQGRKKTYTLTGAVTTVTWLPFIFATPFTGLPATRVNELTQTHWEELLCRMKADGFFDKGKDGLGAVSPVTQKKIEQLRKLKAEGLMTEDEFNAAIKRIHAQREK